MIPENELIVDSFAGGGGASKGIEMASGRSPDIAINHDPEAIAMHTANHPGTRHFCQSIYQVDPDDIMREYRRRIGLAWFSPDCTHHSKARGGKPKQKHIRDLAWIVVHWAERAVWNGQRIRCIVVENVEEFQDWCPLLADGSPDPDQKGSEFHRWCRALRKLGFKVEYRVLRACDYGSPTIRKRLVVIARSDGEDIIWPEATHGPGLPEAHRPASDCIDWTLPSYSIFLTKADCKKMKIKQKRPLAPATMRRVARGTVKYVINAARPFIVPIAHYNGSTPVHDINDPFRTITATPKGGSFALVTAFLAKHYGGNETPGAPLDEPMSTITAQDHHALITTFLAQHNGASVGQSLEAPLSTVTGRDKVSLMSCFISKARGTNIGSALDQPVQTISAQGQHHALVSAFLMKYYGTDQDPRLEEPLHTVTAKDRMALVLVQGVAWQIIDIFMRMLSPRELFRGMGFPESYIIDVMVDKPHWPRPRLLSKQAQVRMCGNSVPPHLACAVVGANFGCQKLLGVAA